MADLASVTGYAIVVAITALPVLGVIAVLLDSGRAARGWVFTGCYASGLVVVFVVASFGLAQLQIPRLRVRGVTELAAGVLLLAVAGTLWLVRRRHASRPHGAAVRPARSAAPVGARRAAVIGLQFAMHPENVALTFAAAAHVTDLPAALRVVSALWFALVGVSTVALPTVVFAVSGHKTRQRLATLRDRIDARKVLLTEVLLTVVGLLLIVLGLWRMLSL